MEEERRVLSWGVISVTTANRNIKRDRRYVMETTETAERGRKRKAHKK